MTIKLIVNSSKIQMSSDGHIKFYLPEEIYLKEFTIVNCSIPYSFYNIEVTNNYFQINSNTYTLTPKNYNAYQLRDAINTLISTIEGVTVTYDRQTSKYTFSKASSFTFHPQQLNVILGFASQLYVGATIVAPNSADLTNNVRDLYIKSNISQMDINAYENGVQGNQILYRIPINCSYGDIIYFQNNASSLSIDMDNRLLFIDIFLTTNIGNIINFNGLSYQLEFAMTTSNDRESARLIYQQMKL